MNKNRIAQIVFWISTVLIVSIVGLILLANFISEDPTRGAYFLQPIDFLFSTYLISSGLGFVWLVVTKFKTKKIYPLTHASILAGIGILWMMYS